MPSLNVDTKTGGARKAQTHVITWQKQNHNNKIQFVLATEIETAILNCSCHVVIKTGKTTNKNEHIKLVPEYKPSSEIAPILWIQVVANVSWVSSKLWELFH